MTRWPMRRRWVELLKGIPAKINLIPFNPWPGSVFECSSNNAIRRFADYLSEENMSAPIRHARGQDIMAACGQLKSASEKLRASARRAAEAEVALRLNYVVLARRFTCGIVGPRLERP